jgi:hypothetical protein
MFYSGVSGRGIGKALHMSKANVYNWIKKTKKILEPNYPLELDELYWFIGKKPQTKTRENVYVMTMVSRTPRQIVGVDAAYDTSPEGGTYCSDGWNGYTDVVYP